MKHSSTAPGTATHQSPARLAGRTLSIGPLGLLLIATGLTSMGMAGTSRSVAEGPAALEVQGHRASTPEDSKPAQAKLEKMVAAGKLSAEDAKRKLGAVHGKSDKGASSKKQHAAAAAKLKKMVAAGKLSAEDAKRKLGAQHGKSDKAGSKESHSKKEKGTADAERRALRERYAEGERRIKEAVEQGRATKEQAERRLMEMRRSMFGSDGKERAPSDADQGAVRERFAEAERKIKQAVVEGRATKEQAEQRLKAMHERLDAARAKDGDEAGGASDEHMAALRRRYGEGARQIKQAVGEGKLTEEEAEAKLREMREKLFGSETKERGRGAGK